MAKTIQILITILIAGSQFNSIAAEAGPPKAPQKSAVQKKDDIPYMMPGVVMANQVWTPDEDGYFRMQGKYVGGKYGFIDKSAKTIIPAQFEKVNNFCDGMCAVKLNGKWGYIDHSGKLVVPAKFNDASDFGEGLAGVRERRGWYVIDKTGATKIAQTKYSGIDTFHDGLCAVKYNEKWGFIDHAGQEILPCKYFMETPPRFQHGIGTVRLEEGAPAKFIDKSGNVLPNTVFDKFKDELAKESRNMQLQRELQKKYSMVFFTTDGLALFKRADGKCGFVDARGNEVIKPIYEDANPFAEGLAGVYMGGHYEKGAIIGKLHPMYKKQMHK